MSKEKRWVLKERADKTRTEELSSVLGIAPVLANLLIQRGIDTYEKAFRFFNPRLENLHNPFLMKDMEQAVRRLDEAIAANQKIMVYGDYDVDGTTAVAIVYSFLQDMGYENMSYYIPDRYTEGYGVSYKAIDHAADEGVGLIIALDCGIKAVEKVAYAKEKGIDFIICDHHLPGDTIPAAVAVLDPKRSDCSYPFEDLSGCGVGFKLLQGYCQYKGLPFSRVESLMDFVAVSIASDIVPLVGENRILAYYGLKRLNEHPGKGLESIIKICGLEKHTITIDDIVFKIGPRINAAGRMVMEDEGNGATRSGGHHVVKLLVAKSVEKATLYGDHIDTWNTDRKSIDRTITTEAHEIVENDPELRNARCTIIYNPSWIKGIVGIVASRLIETYYRPTVILTMSNGFVTGSARSVPGFDLYQAVESCSDLLENFGGHTYAAGMTMKPENVEKFKKRFTDYVNEHIDPEVLIPQVEIDAELTFSEIDPSFRSMLNAFHPFGPGNMSPVFVTRGVSDNGGARLVGAERDHLKMDLVSADNPYNPMSSIAFQQAAFYEHVKAGGQIDVCYTVVENNYRGVVSPQLRIKDIKKSK